MPDTLVTPDGKMHTILGSTTLERIIREYAGDQAAAMVEKLTGRNISMRRPERRPTLGSMSRAWSTGTVWRRTGWTHYRVSSTV